MSHHTELIPEQQFATPIIAETTQIAPSLRDSLGSFVMSRVVENTLIPVGINEGRLHLIEADFDSIETMAGTNLPELFDGYTERLASNPQKAKLLEALATLPEQERKLFTTALFAVDMAKEFFGDKPVDKQVRDKVGWHSIATEGADTYNFKKLSETSDSGLCVEYSVFVQEVMARLDVETHFTVGYRQDWLDENGMYHAFLTAGNGKYIVDPLLMAQYPKTTQPLGMLGAAEEETLISNPQEAVDYTDIFGRSRTYSASPLYAAGKAQVAA
jgi:hypothetical protein